MTGIHIQALALQAQVFCHYAQILGMEAANKERESQGFALAYDEKAFHDQALGLDHLATCLRELSSWA